MSKLEILNRIMEILTQKIAMGQGEGGRIRRVPRKRLGGVMFCDGGEMMDSSESSIDEYDGGVFAGKRRRQKKKAGGVMAGKKCKASGVMAGKRKKAGSNGWITHVKAYQKKHGCTYPEALKKAGASYKK